MSYVIVALPQAGTPLPNTTGDELHTTLAYLDVDPDETGLTEDALVQVARELAMSTEPFSASINGRGRLGEDDAGVLFVEAEEIQELHDRIQDNPYIVVEDTFPHFIPHVTLGYGDSVNVSGTALPGEIKFDRLAVWGPDSSRAEFPLMTVMDKAWTGLQAVPSTPIVVVAAVEGNFDETLHPRGKDGRFIEKFGIVKWLKKGKWTYGKVVGIQQGADGKPDITVSPTDLSGADLPGGNSVIKPKQIYAAPVAKAFLNPKSPGAKKIGGQAGSNPGGLYELPTEDGGKQKVYVKEAKSKDHGRNEWLMNLLYADAGTPVPALYYDENTNNLYSPIIEGKHDMPQRMASNDQEWLDKVRANFVLDSWLANHDVFGMTKDNILTDENGEPWRIDNGGAGLFRAMGAPKADFGDKVNELESMRNKKYVYGDGLTKEHELDGAHRVLAIWPDEIRDRVAQVGLKKSVADTLIARRAYIAQYYGLELPESVTHPDAEEGTIAPVFDAADAAKSRGKSREWFPMSTAVAAVVLNTGDYVEFEDGTQKIYGVGDEGELLSAITKQNQILEWQVKSPTIMARKSKTAHPATMGRPVHGESYSLTEFGDLHWQRGDQITRDDGRKYNVLWANSYNGAVLVQPVTHEGETVKPPFVLNPQHEKGGAKFQVERWDKPDDSVPEAEEVIDIGPEPAPSVDKFADGEWENLMEQFFSTEEAGEPETAEEVEPLAELQESIDGVNLLPETQPGPAAEIAEQLKEDLESPLPKGNGTAPDKPKSVAAVGAKKQILGDGTEATPGDKVQSKFGGEFIYVKSKGPYAVVTDPNADDPDALLQKKASTLSQPDKTPVPKDAAGIPKSANGKIPLVGQLASAPDGHTGKIVQVSPDGVYVFITNDAGKKMRKSTSKVTILGESEPTVTAGPVSTVPTIAVADMKVGDKVKAPQAESWMTVESISASKVTFDDGTSVSTKNVAAGAALWEIKTEDTGPELPEEGVYYPTSELLTIAKPGDKIKATTSEDAPWFVLGTNGGELSFGGQNNDSALLKYASALTWLLDPAPASAEQPVPSSYTLGIITPEDFQKFSVGDKITMPDGKSVQLLANPDGKWTVPVKTQDGDIVPLPFNTFGYDEQEYKVEAAPVELTDADKAAVDAIFNEQWHTGSADIVDVTPEETEAALGETEATDTDTDTDSFNGYVPKDGDLVFKTTKNDYFVKPADKPYFYPVNDGGVLGKIGTDMDPEDTQVWPVPTETADEGTSFFDAHPNAVGFTPAPGGHLKAWTSGVGNDFVFYKAPGSAEWNKVNKGVITAPDITFDDAEIEDFNKITPVDDYIVPGEPVEEDVFGGSPDDGSDGLFLAGHKLSFTPEPGGQFKELLNKNDGDLDLYYKGPGDKDWHYVSASYGSLSSSPVDMDSPFGVLQSNLTPGTEKNYTLPTGDVPTEPEPGPVSTKSFDGYTPDPDDIVMSVHAPSLSTKKHYVKKSGVSGWHLINQEDGTLDPSEHDDDSIAWLIESYGPGKNQANVQAAVVQGTFSGVSADPAEVGDGAPAPLLITEDMLQNAKTIGGSSLSATQKVKLKALDEVPEGHTLFAPGIYSLYLKNSVGQTFYVYDEGHYTPDSVYLTDDTAVQFGAPVSEPKPKIEVEPEAPTTSTATAVPDWANELPTGYVPKPGTKIRKTKKATLNFDTFFVQEPGQKQWAVVDKFTGVVGSYIWDDPEDFSPGGFAYIPQGPDWEVGPDWTAGAGAPSTGPTKISSEIADAIIAQTGITALAAKQHLLNITIPPGYDNAVYWDNDKGFPYFLIRETATGTMYQVLPDGKKSGTKHSYYTANPTELTKIFGDGVSTPASGGGTKITPEVAQAIKSKLGLQTDYSISKIVNLGTVPEGHALWWDKDTSNTFFYLQKPDGSLHYISVSGSVENNSTFSDSNDAVENGLGKIDLSGLPAAPAVDTEGPGEDLPLGNMLSEIAESLDMDFGDTWALDGFVLPAGYKLFWDGDTGAPYWYVKSPDGKYYRVYNGTFDLSSPDDISDESVHEVDIVTDAINAAKPSAPKQTAGTSSAGDKGLLISKAAAESATGVGGAKLTPSQSEIIENMSLIPAGHSLHVSAGYSSVYLKNDNTGVWSKVNYAGTPVDMTGIPPVATTPVTFSQELPEAPEGQIPSNDQGYLITHDIAYSALTTEGKPLSAGQKIAIEKLGEIPAGQSLHTGTSGGPYLLDEAGQYYNVYYDGSIAPTHSWNTPTNTTPIAFMVPPAPLSSLTFDGNNAQVLGGPITNTTAKKKLTALGKPALGYYPIVVGANVYTFNPKTGETNIVGTDGKLTPKASKPTKAQQAQNKVTYFHESIATAPAAAPAAPAVDNSPLKKLDEEAETKGLTGIKPSEMKKVAVDSVIEIPDNTWGVVNGKLVHFAPGTYESGGVLKDVDNHAYVATQVFLDPALVTPDPVQNWAGKHKADQDAISAWGGAVTKDGYIPVIGMHVKKGSMTGTVVGISPDKQKVTVLMSDGETSLRQIEGLSNDYAANYMAFAPKKPTIPAPKGMPLGGVDTIDEALAKTIVDGKFRPILPGQDGIRNGEMYVYSAKTPSGKKVNRVAFVMTKAHRKILKDLLEKGPAAVAVEPVVEKGDWTSSSKQSQDVAVGDQIAMYLSSSPHEDGSPKWKVLAGGGDKPTHEVLSVEPYVHPEGKEGVQKVTLKNTVTGEVVTSHFHPNKTLKTWEWDAEKIKPPPAPVYDYNSGQAVKLSAAAQAAGWQVTGSNDAVVTAVKGGVFDQTLAIEPGQAVPTSQAAYGHSAWSSGGLRMVSPDGVVIEVTSLDSANNSWKGNVVVTLPEGMGADRLNTALTELGLAHKPLTQSKAKENMLPMLRNMLNIDHTDVDTTKGKTAEQLFEDAGKTMGLDDVGWHDVLIATDESTGNTAYYWSERVRAQLESKAHHNLVYRAASTATADLIASTAKYGTAGAIAKRITGMVYSPSGKGLGVSPDDDAGNNAGNGGFFYADHVPDGQPLHHVTQHTFKPGGMIIVSRATAATGRIQDYRAALCDAYGKGVSHLCPDKTNMLGNMLGTSKIKDYLPNGGLPIESTSLIAVGNETERLKAIKMLKDQGINDINGVPVEDFIVDSAKLKTMKVDDLPPVFIPANARPILDLPESYDDAEEPEPLKAAA